MVLNRLVEGMVVLPHINFGLFQPLYSVFKLLVTSSIKVFFELIVALHLFGEDRIKDISEI